MIKPISQRRIRVAAIKVPGVHTTEKTRNQNANGQKQDAFHCALLSFPGQMCHDIPLAANKHSNIAPDVTAVTVTFTKLPIRGAVVIPQRRYLATLYP